MISKLPNWAILTDVSTHCHWLSLHVLTSQFFFLVINQYVLRVLRPLTKAKELLMNEGYFVMYFSGIKWDAN